MKRLSLIAPFLIAACGVAPGGDDTTGDDVPNLDADADCPDMFQQSVVPEYHVTISAAEWAKLEDEFLHRREREEAGLEVHPYHPIELGYVAGDEVVESVPNVLLRLKGNSSWLQALDLDDSPKMQFVLAFNEVDPAGRFKGVRKIELDMPRIDQTFLHQRLGLAFMREAGLPAQCANNARVYINGEYYGLYTNLERLDKEFLQRVYGKELDDGDLWKGGWEIKTNEDTYDPARILAFNAATDLATIEEYADVDASMYEWAVETMIGDADGYSTGRANFYLYDHPTRGFIWLPHDVDAVLDWDFWRPDSTLLYPDGLFRDEDDWHHYRVALADPAGLQTYLDKLHEARSHLDVAAFQERIDLWAAQIAAAAAEDVNKPFDMAAHALAISRTRDYVPARADYIDAWLACRDSGGPDGDGDGYDMCHDCNDAEAAVRPGAVEVCNMRDDNCDGLTDFLDRNTSVCQ